nr:unnamed protein product [Digitaria exilis]
MMGCLFGCFRASAGGGGGREGKGGDDGGQLAHPSVAPATSHEPRSLDSACLWCVSSGWCGEEDEAAVEERARRRVPARSSSKPNDELQSSATSLANNVEDLTMTNESNTEACVQDEEQQVLDLAKDYEECGVSKEEILQPEQSENPSCAKNDNVVSMEISMSDECSLFHSSEGSISSSNKTRDSMKATSMEKPLETEATIHATGKKVLKNNDSEQELPSLSHWLKPPNRKKTFRDDALTGDRSHSAKSSDEDRPIIGMDQKVSWHATPFEERLEKALSEEKSLSERNCSSGKTSQFLGVEGEESTTAESNRLYAAAYSLVSSVGSILM